MGQESYPINIWINEERLEKLQQAGLGHLVADVLAGLKVIQVPTTPEQKEAILKKFPMAKCDTATTGTIELLPREVKNRIFDLLVEKRRANGVVGFSKGRGAVIINGNYPLNARGYFPRFYSWDNRKGCVWAFGWLTGADDDLICAIREPKSRRQAEIALSPICSNRPLAILAFLLKALLMRLDQNARL